MVVLIILRCGMKLNDMFFIDYDIFCLLVKVRDLIVFIECVFESVMYF